MAPALLLAGGVAFVAAGVASGRAEAAAAARQARSALELRIESEVARAAAQLRDIVTATRDRGVFKDVPFPLDIRTVTRTRAAAPAPEPALAEAERLEFAAGAPDAAVAELRRVAATASPAVAATALREEGRILLRLGHRRDARDALQRAAATEGANERDVLLARFELAKQGDAVLRDTLRGEIVSGGFASVQPAERLVVLRALGGAESEIVALAAEVALDDVADPTRVVVVDARHVAWRLDRSGDAHRAAVAPIDAFAAGLVPAAAERLVTASPSSGAAWPAPFPPLAFEPTAAAAAQVDRAAAVAARTRWLPAALIGAAFAAGAVFTFVHGRARAELDRGKDAFLCAVTHELKTPIANILLYAETLKEHGAADTPSIPKFTGTIAAEALRLGARVAEILDVASGRAGVPGADERFDAAAAVREVAAEFAERAGGLGVRFECELLAAGPAQVRGSPRMFRRAIAAVIGNAFAFAPDGAVRMEAARQAGRFRVTVDDDGPGVPAADRERVFEPFVRLADERTRDVPGTGLGLTLARQGVEACGGTIRCEARDGGGARFVVEVPEA